MGNEISTIGGAVATAATSVAAGVTFGQVDCLNEAVVDCAKFTADQFMDSTVRHVGETVGTGVAVVGTSIAAGVTFGQVDALNDAVVATANHTANSAIKSGGKVVEIVDGVADGLPVVGHIKGGIHYAFGDKDGGDKAMKAASRSTGVLAGGAIGILGGPVGMIAGGISGGAAMDGITTGVESAIEGEYTPSGQIEAWTRVAKAKNAQECIGGIVQGVMTPVGDAMAGYGAGKMVKNFKNVQMYGAEKNMQSYFGNGNAVGLSLDEAFDQAAKAPWQNPSLRFEQIMGNLSADVNTFVKSQFKGSFEDCLKKAIDEAFDEFGRQIGIGDGYKFFLCIVKHLVKEAVDPKAAKEKLIKCSEFKEKLREYFKDCQDMDEFNAIFESM